MKTIINFSVIVIAFFALLQLGGCAIAPIVAPYAMDKAMDYTDENPETVSSIKNGAGKFLGDVADGAKNSFSWLKRQVSGEKEIAKEEVPWVNPDIRNKILPREKKRRVALPGVKIIDDTDIPEKNNSPRIRIFDDDKINQQKFQRGVQI